jgi:hypothetical protein
MLRLPYEYAGDQPHIRAMSAPLSDRDCVVAVRPAMAVLFGPYAGQNGAGRQAEA